MRPRHGCSAAGPCFQGCHPHFFLFEFKVLRSRSYAQPRNKAAVTDTCWYVFHRPFHKDYLETTCGSNFASVKTSTAFARNHLRCTLSESKLVKLPNVLADRSGPDWLFSLARSRYLFMSLFYSHLRNLSITSKLYIAYIGLPVHGFRRLCRLAMNRVNRY